MRKFLLTLALVLTSASSAYAQNIMCPDKPSSDSSNACANTRFVHQNAGGVPALPNGQIFIGNASNVATPQTVNGDCTLTSGGTITCTGGGGGGPTTVNTVNDLRNLASPSTHPVVSVLGYNTAYDNGGGTFVMDANSCTDDGVLKFNSTTAGYCYIRQYDGILSPYMGGAVGDGTTNDTAAIQRVEDVAVAGQTINFGSGIYLIAPIGSTTSTSCANCYAVLSKAGVQHIGGTIKWTATTTLYGAFVAADNTVFRDMTFIGSGTIGTLPSSPLYQAAIVSGATSTAGRSPASHVVVQGSKFSNMTVGVWVNPDTADSTPLDWNIDNNQFTNIVGRAGVSEGYGVVAGLANQINTTNNHFTTIKRHAVYYTAILEGVIGNNTILTVDNIAIQLNTFSSQPPNLNITISNNTIAGFTRSINYGYTSSVGIGIYGKSVSCNVTGNQITNPLDIGIDIVGIQGDTIPTGSRVNATGNHIIMDATATTAGMRIQDFYEGSASANKIELQSGIYGFIVTNTQAITGPVIISHNQIFSTSLTAGGLRTVLTGAQTVLAYSNVIHNIPGGNQWIDSSLAGFIRTDINSGYRTISSDGNYTYVAGGYNPQDAGVVAFTGTLTANRTFALDTTFIPNFIKTMTLINKSAANFSFSVTNGVGGSAISTVNQNTWATFTSTQSGGWALTAAGSI